MGPGTQRLELYRGPCPFGAQRLALPGAGGRGVYLGACVSSPGVVKIRPLWCQQRGHCRTVSRLLGKGVSRYRTQEIIYERKRIRRANYTTGLVKTKAKAWCGMHRGERRVCGGVLSSYHNAPPHANEPLKPSHNTGKS